MPALGLLVGYLIGSLPTANGLAAIWGVDLRTSGTGNPGANNARQVGGLSLAIAVLLVEIGKGVLAVFAGAAIGGDLGAALAGLGAVAGNVYNVWYRFSGGKGLGIASGVVLAIWPYAFPVLFAVLILATVASKSSGMATLVTLAACLILSVLWWAWDLPAGWGVTSGGVRVLLASGLLVIMAPKHLHDARHPVAPATP